MHWSWYLLFCILLLYSVRILTYLIGWNKSIRGREGPLPSNPDVSIVIPFRNEESHLPGLLGDLAGQDYPSQHFEVILVDDHSTDQSAVIVSEAVEKYPNFYIYKLTGSGFGKKNALQLGIRKAGKEIVLTTDGDCRMGPGWISEMVREFSKEDVRMVLGAVVLEPTTGFFRQIQAFEFFSLTGTTAGAVARGKPILCNAANMAFLRRDFVQYTEVADQPSTSGDDIFLLHWMKKSYPGSIRFAISHESVVSTAPMDSVREFINQRIRWTSKARYYRDRDILVTAVLVYLVNLCLLAAFTAGFFRPDYFYCFTTVMAVKLTTDLLFLSAILEYYSLRKRLWLILPAEIIYFAYVSVIGLAGQIVPYRWKERKVRITG